MQQHEVEKIHDTSSITVYRVKKAQTVHDVLTKLNLEQKYFSVLINGIKVEQSHIVETEDHVLVLPKIAGD